MNWSINGRLFLQTFVVRTSGEALQEFLVPWFDNCRKSAFLRIYIFLNTLQLPLAFNECMITC